LVLAQATEENGSKVNARAFLELIESPLLTLTALLSSHKMPKLVLPPLGLKSFGSSKPASSSANHTQIFQPGMPIRHQNNVVLQRMVGLIDLIQEKMPTSLAVRSSKSGLQHED